jgi:G3E family GTPase
MQGDFITGIEELVSTYSPDRIIIEPTGIAQISEITSACEQIPKSFPIKINAVITVVNAIVYPKMIKMDNAAGAFFTEQITNAWFMILSAIQNLPSKGINLDEITDSIHHLNPSAPVLAEAWDKIHGLTLLAAAEEVTASRSISDASPGEAHHEHGHHEHGHGEHGHGDHEHGDHDHEHGDHEHVDFDEFSSVSFTIAGEWTSERVQDLFEALKTDHYGEIFRAKGFIPLRDKILKIDYVYGISNCLEIDYHGGGKLVIIGRDLMEEELERLVGEPTA